MLGRGAINVFSCFVDVIVHTVNDTKSGPPLVGTLTGLGRGLGCGVLRLGSGAVDLVTFWVPGFNGIPVSPAYNSCGTQGTDTAYEGYERESFPSYQSMPPMQPIPASEPVAQPPVGSTQDQRTWSK
jgi:putative exosortase-associated protein (TIGR04073 family)